ncbi:hypothetical protein IKF67_01985 [Candidatus Saccharibacteria bacterium]|nr:hypothetical protein [Candidatus Saccharibacteria bacterium]
MVKKGDTLIEVTLAVGIFSMIAIAVVSVMSGGTSSAQTALETTLAREEIDTQAEALRFIQASYISDKDSSNKRFINLWKAITDKAIVLGDNEDENGKITQFSPTTCSELYNSDPNNPDFKGSIFEQNAFILNTRKLGVFTADDVNSVYIAANDENVSKFSYASTYPRLIYSKNATPSSSDTNGLLEDTSADNLFRAEGIYVIAVKDSNTTTIVDDSGTPKASAFYDFYIRTCWYGSGAEQASTISTVIRLYDPDAAAVVPESPEEEPEEPTPEEPGD